MSKIMKNTLFTAAVLYMIMGLGLIILKQSVLNVICYIAGAAGIIYGAIKLFTFFYAQEKGTSMVSGGILFVLGLLLVFRASYIVTIFSVLVGIAIAIDSIFKIQTAIDMKNIGKNKWKALLISALVMLAISLVLLFDPFNGSAFIAVAMGIALIADAVLNFICIWIDAKSAPDKANNMPQF